MKILSRFIVGGIVAAGVVSHAAEPPKKEQPMTGPVSYYKQIRPIFQASCQGCHQPAKAKGGYVMTDFAKMLDGGDSKDKKHAIVAKKPKDSLLVEQITPVNGEAEMPKGKPALAAHEIELITRWVVEGAIDDTPDNARQRYDKDHPPVYTMPPVVASLDFSPDGKYLAVAGFHEVLLHNGDGSGIAARLVGLSERIESVRFSPDGKLLAVAGGQPARMGEIQIWDVEKRELKVSVPVTYDTVYGVSWSPDGKMIAFGCADNTVRAIDSATGKQVLQQGSHSDWVLDTAFSVKGDHIISVGRDMSTKLTEVATQRFVDNITSITPGALRGGLHSVARHPNEDFVLVGGSDGAPQIYRIFRQTARKIGDNANLIRRFPEMPGRIFSVTYSHDGKMFAAGSSLDGAGQVVVYEATSDANIPAKIKKIMDKTFDQQSAEEKKELEQFQTQGIKLAAQASFPACGIYAVTFSPDGKFVAAAGQDGTIRFISTDKGEISKQIAAAPVTGSANFHRTSIASAAPSTVLLPATNDEESLPKDVNVVSLDVQPGTIKITKPTDYVQLIVTAKLSTGDSLDATRMVSIKPNKIGEVSPRGIFTPRKNGKDKLQISLGKYKTNIQVEVSGVNDEYKVDFIRDVNPVLTKLGCNAGTCHGAKDGKNGFKLSLRGYDPIMDVRGFVDDQASRRASVASPDDSLMLLKPTAAVPHEGGLRMKPSDKYYEIVRQWIADGAKLYIESPRVTKIELAPQNPVIQTIGWKQQIRVLATYSDGVQRDVTAEAFIDSGNNDVATTDSAGLVSTLRRGEAPILARFEGNYAATTVTVMGDRSGFAWKEPPTYSQIDEFVAAKWKRMKILPSDVCSDSDFIRRVYLDLTGLPPTEDDVVKFLADTRETRVKRDELIDKLIGNPEFVDHWANKWADLLQLNRKFLGTEGAQQFREWIRKQIADNVPYDQFVRSIITASGSNNTNPPASYYKILREPSETVENTTHLFLATRFNCNKCHDHPFERWTQDQYYQTAAYFAQVEIKADPASGDRKIGGTAVEGAKPLFEIIGDKKDGDVKHLRTNKVAPPQFPFPAKYEVKDPQKATRREHLAAWMTSPDNRYFAMSYVNRLWGYLTGVGIIEPLDDIRAGNPPSNPELLDYLTKEFISHNFDVRHVLRIICKSRTYQLALSTNEWNADDKTNYSHAIARRLPAEVLYDAVFTVTGATPNIPGVKPGTRAAQLPDSGIDLPSGFLATLGRPPRESACECERSNDIRLGSVMSLLSGPTVSDAIGDANNAIAKLVASQTDDQKLFDSIFMRVLNRHATPAEINTAVANMNKIDQENQKLVAELDAMEKKYAPIIAEQERKRAEAIEKAKNDLASYEKSIAPKVAEDEKKRVERVAADEKALAEYEPTLPTKLVEWEKTVTAAQKETTWIVVDPTEYKASGNIKLEKFLDSSIAASGPRPNTEYTISAEVNLQNITGIKLEVLPDEKSPKFGPGRADDGNFVLSEIKLEYGPKSEKNMTAAKIVDGKADFTQKDFDVKLAFDGKNDGKGWAISGTPAGNPHFATFKLEKPIGDAKGTNVKFTLYQRFSDNYSIGRFRLWVTTAANPLEFGLPTPVADLLKVDVAKRTKEQNESLLAYYKGVDPELRKKQQSLHNNKQPLPIDPKIAELKKVVTEAEQPIKIEPKLVQIREDAKMSAQQAANKRLTAAQDLAWALINNPAFLFNH